MGETRLALEWDTGVRLSVRQEMERALGALLIDTYDSTDVDLDPDAPPRARLRLLASASTGSGAASREPGVLVVVLGDGQAGSAPRLAPEDIGAATPRWIGFLRRLGDLLERPGLAARAEAANDPEAMKAWALAYPGDPLARDVDIGLRTDVLMDRAANAEAARERATSELRRTRRTLSEAERERAASVVTAQTLEREKAALLDKVEQLKALAEDGAYPLSDVPQTLRDLVHAARTVALRAKQEGALGETSGAMFAGARSWMGGAAVYDGETRNDLPHGRGVMKFRSGSEPNAPFVAGYSGQYVAGRRQGLGVGRDADGSIWSGEWQDDQACGLGILDAADGRRFEGRVKPGLAGPIQEDGYVWPARARPAVDGGTLWPMGPARLDRDRP